MRTAALFCERRGWGIGARIVSIGFRSPPADGRKNVADGDSRGEKAEPIRLKNPGRGDRAVLIIADLLSPLCGSACSPRHVIPRLGRCEKIAAQEVAAGLPRHIYCVLRTAMAG
jgi:hypothetical protein